MEKPPKLKKNKNYHPLLWDDDPRIEQLNTLLQSENNWLNKSESEFVRNSITQKEFLKRRKRRNLLLVIAGLSVLFVAALVAAAIALYQAQIVREKLKTSEIISVALQKASRDATIALQMVYDLYQKDPTNSEIIQSFNTITGNPNNNFYFKHLYGYHNFTSVILSPNETLLFAAEQSGSAKIYDLINNKSIDFKAHTEDIVYSAFSADSQKILTGSLNGTVRLWDTKGKNLLTFKLQQTVIFALSFLYADNTEETEIRGFIVMDADGNVKILDLEGKPTKEYKLNVNTLADLAISSKGEFIVTVSQASESKVTLWDAKTQELLISGFNPTESTGDTIIPNIARVAISADGSHLAIWDVWEGISLWNHKGELLRTYQVDERLYAPSNMQIQGEMIVITDQMGYVSLMNFYNDKVNTFKAHDYRVCAALVSNKNNFLLTAGSLDLMLKFWDFQPKNKFNDDNKPVTDMAKSPDGKYLISCDGGPVISLWDTGKKIVIKEINTQVQEEYSSINNYIAFSPDGNSFICNAGPLAILFNMKGEQVLSFEGHKDDISFIRFSPDGNYVLTSSRDETVRLWNIKGENLQTIQVGYDGYPINFMPDSKSFLTNGETLINWDLNGKKLKSFEWQNDVVFSSACSSSGRYIATGDPKGNIRLWDTENKKLKVLEGHSDMILDLEFSKDESLILSASQDRTSRLWSITGENLQTFTQKDKFIKAFFLSDDEHIAFASKVVNFSPILDEFMEERVSKFTPAEFFMEGMEEIPLDSLKNTEDAVLLFKLGKYFNTEADYAKAEGNLNKAKENGELAKYFFIKSNQIYQNEEIPDIIAELEDKILAETKPEQEKENTETQKSNPDALKEEEENTEIQEINPDTLKEEENTEMQEINPDTLQEKEEENTEIRESNIDTL